MQITDNLSGKSKFKALFHNSSVCDLFGKYNDVEVKLYSETRGSGNSQTTYYIIKAFFEKDLSLGLSVYKEGFLSKIGKIVGTQDIQIDWNELDDLVMIKGNNEQKVIDLFNRRVGFKEAVRDLFSNKMNGDFQIDDRSVIYEKPSTFLNKPDFVVSLLDNMTKVVTAQKVGE